MKTILKFIKSKLNATWKRQEDFLLLLDARERYTKSISFLYYFDVIEMIVRTKKKKEEEEEENKTGTNKSLAATFFTAINPQTSSYFQSC